MFHRIDTRSLTSLCPLLGAGALGLLLAACSGAGADDSSALDGSLGDSSEGELAMPVNAGAAPGELGSVRQALRNNGAGDLGCPTLGFSCGPFSCECRGDDDCNSMFCSNVCAGDAYCDETQGVVCRCSRLGGLNLPKLTLATRAAGTASP